MQGGGVGAKKNKKKVFFWEVFPNIDVGTNFHQNLPKLLMMKISNGIIGSVLTKYAIAMMQ